MKKLMFILVFLSNFLFSQNMTFIYELKFRSNPSKDSLTTETYYLEVLDKQSVFRSERARVSDSLKAKTGNRSTEKMTYDQFYIVKNKETKEVIKSITAPLMNNEFFFPIDDQLVWEILPEKNTIGGMQCQKATVKYGSRNWIAWFDQKTPIQDGPYIFHGLPGIIVKISDDKGDYDFSLSEIKNNKENKMFYLRKGKRISWEDYTALQKNYYSEPFSAIKNSSTPFKVIDEKGNHVEMDLKQLTKRVQKQIRENNNPIELNQKIEYK